ncbi:hypothetical protein BGZ63DRAFT_409591 [Mariannaea sp. PMI_226]|nr:hypothetical protein BGZ63DRAFT_409591 [Mariannaea sp. PMI_226]
MDSTSESPSSAYSDDVFELEQLLRRLSKQKLQHESKVVEILEREKVALEHKVSQLRQKWASICQVMERTLEVANRLKVACDDAESQIELERKKWVANCTAF